MSDERGTNAPGDKSRNTQSGQEDTQSGFTSDPQIGGERVTNAPGDKEDEQSLPQRKGEWKGPYVAPSCSGELPSRATNTQADENPLREFVAAMAREYGPEAGEAARSAAQAFLLTTGTRSSTPSATNTRNGETPRTDALMGEEPSHEGLRHLWAGHIDKLYAHARQLERELAGAMDRCDEALAAAEEAVRQRDSCCSTANAEPDLLNEELADIIECNLAGQREVPTAWEKSVPLYANQWKEICRLLRTGTRSATAQPTQAEGWMVAYSGGKTRIMPGDVWQDEVYGGRWRVLRPSGSRDYSPSGFGGTPGFWCELESGEMPKHYANYVNEKGEIEFCGDSIAASLARHRAPDRSGSGR